MKKATKPVKAPNFMVGKICYVDENDNGSEPVSLKEFTNNIISNGYSASLSRGNIIPKTKTAEQHIIFDCSESEHNDSCTFKLFLYEKGDVKGRINYLKKDNEQPQQEYFKGNYKKLSNSQIYIWGVWCTDIEYKIRYPVLIELKKTIRRESEYDKVNVDKRKKQNENLQAVKEKFFEPHSTAELKKTYKLLFNTPNSVLYVPIKEEIDRRANQKKSPLKN